MAQIVAIDIDGEQKKSRPGPGMLTNHKKEWLT